MKNPLGDRIVRRIILSFSVVLIVMAAVAFANAQSSEKEPITVPPKAKATPCPTANSDNDDPCGQTPSAIDDVKRSKRKSISWEERKRLLLEAEFPLINETSMDVDGDGKPDKVLYQIKPWLNDFEGMLRITSADNRIIWEHEFFMSSNDLAKFLFEVLNYDSIKDWVREVFTPGASYSFRSETRKLGGTDLHQVQIDHAAKIYKMKPEKLKSAIISGDNNQVFTFRAEWREDLMQIVYVPQLKKFVCFSRGY